MRREADESREAIGRVGEIGRRRDQDRAIGRKAVMQRDRCRRAAHRMADDCGGAAEMPPDSAHATRELGQRRRVALAASVSGLIEGDDRVAARHAARRSAAGSATRNRTSRARSARTAAWRIAPAIDLDAGSPTSSVNAIARGTRCLRRQRGGVRCGRWRAEKLDGACDRRVAARSSSRPKSRPASHIGAVFWRTIVLFCR